ncbi:Clavaminate synthase-like protein [Anopheles sinensis]|uniref:Clavaminate synthase-like protein n=1 Tax=Anopheles sinensis TaxID=74873 RepID=A0A084VUY7_ANOSI|nr:Clavaminate synthase-like protein [Anopheles sinensis]
MLPVGGRQDAVLNNPTKLALSLACLLLLLANRPPQGSRRVCMENPPKQPSRPLLCGIPTAHSTGQAKAKTAHTQDLTSGHTVRQENV